MLLEKESDGNIYYDDKDIIKCPHCNIILFYINNNWEHECNVCSSRYISINNTIFRFITIMDFCVRADSLDVNVV